MTRDDVLAILRHLSGLLAGALVSHGVADADNAQAISGGVMALLVVGWSLWQKRRPSSALVDRAVQKGL